MPNDVPRPLSFRRPQDSGPLRTWHPVWLIVAVILVPVVFWLQQFSIGLRSMTLEHAPRERLADETPIEPGLDELTFSAKLMVKMHSLGEDEEAGSVAELDEYAITRAERLRVAIVAGEMEGAEAALERLDALAKEAEPNGDLAHELAWLEKIYHDQGADMPQEARQSLVDRHGWFGELALVFGRANHEHVKQAVVGGAGRLVSASLGLMALGAISFLGGIGAAAMVLVKWKSGEYSSGLNEAVGGPLYLETFVVFLGGFLLVLAAPIVMFGIGAEATGAAVAVGEIMTWLLVLTLAWPLFRGVKWERFAWDVGLHRGEGFWREVWSGVFGYLASIPLVLIVILGTGIVEKMIGASEGGGTSGYPMFEQPRGGGWGMMVLEVLSLVVWAPVVEEIIFRGALYRYLRGGLRWWGAVLVTAAVFGLVHPYTTAGIVQVGIIGIVFGLLREWRGSLIAPMVAHALHNGTIALTTVMIMAAID